MAEQFRDFFRRVTGAWPYPYQERLATQPTLPELLAVPTGAGKTAAAIVGWMWRRREASEEIRRDTPRRLVFCLPMRTLVAQTARRAAEWAQRAGGDPQVRVHTLMGGAVDSEWDVSPESDAILIGTQDQLLSRALNRGFAMSRFRWPVHFALLNNDVLWVYDEVQLMGAALSTSAQLQAFREAFRTFFASRSLWMSATLTEGRLATIDFGRRSLNRVQLDQDDWASPLDAKVPNVNPLATRLRARKHLTLARTRWQPNTSAYAAALSEEVLGAHVEGTRTIVVMNRVARARALFRRMYQSGTNVPLALVHSRFRPADRREVEDVVLADGWSGILVTTQALEAGVDVSSRTLFTELAPTASLIQRFGRCNRAGEWAPGQATVRWIDLPDDEAVARPYGVDELAAAREWVRMTDDVGPDMLHVLPKDDEPALPVIRRRDLLDLFDTQADLSGCDIDVSPYVRDASDPQVHVAWRSWEGDAPSKDEPFPSRDELCPVPIGEIRDFMKRASAWRWDSLEGEWSRVTNPSPGQVLMLHSSSGGYDLAEGWTGEPSHRPVAPVQSRKSGPPDDDSSDFTSTGRPFVRLIDHTNAVVEEVEGLMSRLGSASQFPDPVLRRAARWHDAGKAHPVFQAMLVSSLSEGDSRRGLGPWAKSDSRSRCERRHFRHELASALALLAHGGGDLDVYLIAAHHGKVRLAVRSRPGETSGDEGPTVLGLRAGDTLPVTDLGDGVLMDEVTLDLDFLALGDGARGPSWRTRTALLLQQWGPFRLAYLETLLRVADWRASARDASSPLEVLAHE